MYPRGKKRKLEPASASSTEADRKRLRSLLERCDELKIVKTLVDRLGDASVEEIKSLKSLLAQELACLEPELHCVRCHETYFESRNGSDECQIPHSDKEGAAQDEDELWAGFACCGEDFDEEDVICIFAKHTTDEGMVIYYGDEPVDEDDEYFAQNENVKRCEEMGCNVG
ncbi:hypothetical protein FRC10_009429 [Ceratobasidium sp. 414]|nr:hypothetical protein FRC10_009429 [Ceratobasidium sp. 414]